MIKGLNDFKFVNRNKKRTRIACVLV